jgi:hypothetical protein
VERSEGYCRHTYARGSSPEPGKKSRQPPEHLQSLLKNKTRWGQVREEPKGSGNGGWRTGIKGGYSEKAEGGKVT